MSQRIPGAYIAFNTDTQRTGLPIAEQRILLVTSDGVNIADPVPVYDTSTADAQFGANSIAGRMARSAVASCDTVDMDGIALGK